VVAHLRSAYFQVSALDIRRQRLRFSIPTHHGRYQDLSEAELGAYDGIVVLAGHSSVGACEREPAAAFDNNVAGFADLVHKLHGPKLIFASSISVYVDTAGREAREQDPLPEAVCLYDMHKQSIERYADLAYPNHYALRFGTVSGPSPAIRQELLLNSLVRSAVTKGKIRVANPQTHRPLLGINDLCRAIEAILTRPVPPGRYNLASLNASVGELADYIAQRFDVPLEEIELPTRYDVQVDNAKFRAAAGFAFTDTLPSLVEQLHDYYAQDHEPTVPIGAAR
jgi:nucleoside-diphosphate-sugar epimerase